MKIELSDKVRSSHAGHVAWLVLVALIGSLVGYAIGVDIQNSNNIEDSFSLYTGVAKKSSALKAGYSLYKNSQYGFSFQYPSTWTQDTQSSSKDSAGVTYLYAIYFSDATMQQKIDCNNNDWQKWAPPLVGSLSQAQCKPLIAAESATEIDKLHGPLSADGIFVRVYSNTSNQTVKDWLLANYKLPNTELENYTQGKAIKLGGVSGYTSQIGCCSAYDLSYVVQHGSYIYELGTKSRLNDSGGTTRETYDNSTIQIIGETFKFSK